MKRAWGQILEKQKNGKKKHKKKEIEGIVLV